MTLELIPPVEPTPAARKVNIFVASENRLLREALAKILRKKMGIRNVESAALSQNPKKQIEDARSDILLLDSVGATRPMPQLVKQINCELPELQVILIGMEADVQTFIWCVEAGIAGNLRETRQPTIDIFQTQL